MEKRKLVLGTYDTAAHGWTLTGCQLSPAEQKTNYIDKPNGDGSWDLSTALTDGLIRYKDRQLVATLECSEGTRRDRVELIRHLVNNLDGMKVEIHLPDDEAHHVVGRLQIVPEYNDLAHAAVTVSALCEPWKYANTETVVTVKSTEAQQVITLHNAGRRAVVPVLSVAGDTVDVTYAGSTKSLPSGCAEKWGTLLLTPGEHVLMYDFGTGTGTLTITYREAVLE